MFDIVIVNWNSGPQLRHCIDSIAKYGDGLVGKIIVVDNGSVDGSESTVDGYSSVELIRANTNLGFGKACNLGAKNANGDFILFLNPDAALYQGTLARCWEYMNTPANKHVGICGVQLIDENDALSRSCSRFPSLAGFVSHATGLDRLFPRLGHAMVDWDHEDVRFVDQVIGAFFVIRRELFVSLNGFDERFFVYFEEVDLSLRAFKKGARSVYLADTKAFHAGGGTSRQVKARRLFYSLRSRLLYSFKHFSFGAAILVLLATLLIEPITRLSHAILRLSWAGVKEILGGFGMLWLWLPEWRSEGAAK